MAALCSMIMMSFDSLLQLQFQKIAPLLPSMRMRWLPSPGFMLMKMMFFPEELKGFIEFSGSLREVFLEYHADLFEVDFWQKTQDNDMCG